MNVSVVPVHAVPVYYPCESGRPVQSNLSFGLYCDRIGLTWVHFLYKEAVSFESNVRRVVLYDETLLSVKVDEMRVMDSPEKYKGFEGAFSVTCARTVEMLVSLDAYGSYSVLLRREQ